jgi:CheY-like chemotaxis protein
MSIESSPIMLVDDDDDLRMVIGQLLEESGYDVIEFSSATEALDSLRGGLRPRLILLDLMMPGMTGYEFRAAQRTMPQLAQLPVVLLTAHPTPNLDGLPVLHKPFSAETLLGVVGHHSLG